jgi:hypothetical protein
MEGGHLYSSNTVASPTAHELCLRFLRYTLGRVEVNTRILEGWLGVGPCSTIINQGGEKQQLRVHLQEFYGKLQN